LSAFKRGDAAGDRRSSVARKLQQAITNPEGDTKSESGPASPPDLMPLTAQLFAQTETILNRLRTESAAALADAVKPLTPAALRPTEINLIDPQAAATQILNQATQTLDVAVQALIDSMHLPKQTPSTEDGASIKLLVDYFSGA